MKKFWLSFLGLASVGSFLLTGCEKDDPTPVPVEPTTVAKWQLDMENPVYVSTDDLVTQATLQGFMQGLLASTVEKVIIALKSDSSLHIQWQKEGEEPIELSESLPGLQLKYTQTEDGFTVLTDKTALEAIIGSFAEAIPDPSGLIGALVIEGKEEFLGIEFHGIAPEASGITIYLETEKIQQLLPIAASLIPPTEGMDISQLIPSLLTAEKLEVGLHFDMVE
ncbi:MAG: hypothetical protein LBU03_01600 [Tannerellaceae bacterium]|nr:hypothetical protein [Tannerellaceae bacterium]